MPYNLITTSTAVAAPVTTAGAPLVSEGETLATLEAELDLQLGDRDDVDSTRRKKFINDAYKEMCASLDLSELWSSLLIASVATKPFYLLPKQVSFIKRVSISDAVNYSIDEGRQLKKSDLAGYRMRPVADDDTPVEWFKYGRRILVLYPAPDTVYSLPLDFKVRPDALVNPTDSPLFPEELHKALQMKCRQVAWNALRNYKEAAIAQNEYVTAVRVLLDTDAEERQSEETHFSPAREVRDLYRNRGRR